MPTTDPGLRVQISTGGLSAVSAVNLRAINNTSTPNSKIDFTADMVVLVDKSSPARSSLFSSVSQTFDIATDLDTGSEASSTWYYCWLVSTNGSSLTRKISTSATLPSGLSSTDYRVRVCSIYNNASSNFRSISKTGDRIEYQGDWPTAASANGEVTTWTSVSVSTIVPTVSIRVHGVTWSYPHTAGPPGPGMYVAITGDNTKSTSLFDTSTVASCVLAFAHPADTFRRNFAAYYEIWLKTSQTIYWASSGSLGQEAIQVGGYWEPLGW